LGEEKVIDIHDETAKILAQVLTNDKALAILHALEENPKSISELAAELGFPISTVSYHIDRMLKVGLVEVAGIKYGKKLQEVKLYRASNRPILLVPKKEAAKVTKRLPAFERLHVISLSIASLVSVVVYLTSEKLIQTSSRAKSITPVMNVSNATIQTMKAETPSRLFVPNSTTSSPSSITSSPMNYSGSSYSISGGTGWLPVLLAVATFFAVFLLSCYIMRRKFPKRF
jgi:DNA-binding transcriptional ArsR family regulator